MFLYFCHKMLQNEYNVTFLKFILIRICPQAYSSSPRFGILKAIFLRKQNRFSRVFKGLKAKIINSAPYDKMNDIGNS